MANPILELHAVSLFLSGKRILDTISFTLGSAEILTIIGPNGAGKTSLLKIILGFIKPTTGSVVRTPTLRIGYVPQKVTANPFLPLSVSDFLILGNTCSSHEIQMILERFDLFSLQKSLFYDLSGGEKQRVLLARAFLRFPNLLILDEPTQSLDSVGQNEFYARLSCLLQQFNCAVLLVSHDLNWVMAQSNTILCLNKHICCSGHPQIIKDDQRYKDLFSHNSAMAPYTHFHDHSHDAGI